MIPDENEIKPIVLRPEISAEWVSANKIKPDLKAFYDKELYERVMFDSQDFQLAPLQKSEVTSFDAYLSHYALLN